jgi:alpha-N-acetylglucosaminidase
LAYAGFPLWSDLRQGWLFFDQMDFWSVDRIEAYLGGVEDPTEMIVLDLFSEAEPQWNRTESYFGKRWVWCLLHGFPPWISLMKITAGIWG